MDFCFPKKKVSPVDNKSSPIIKKNVPIKPQAEVVKKEVEEKPQTEIVKKKVEEKSKKVPTKKIPAMERILRNIYPYYDYHSEPKAEPKKPLSEIEQLNKLSQKMRIQTNCLDRECSYRNNNRNQPGINNSLASNQKQYESTYDSNFFK